MAARRSPPRRRYVRRWRRAAIGLVGPSDVRDIQQRVHDYRATLQGVIDRAAGSKSALPLSGPFNIADWGDLVGRCVKYEAEGESSWNPLNYLYAGTAWERGRGLVGELDSWRDELARRGAPDVPAPLPVPHSDVGLAGGIALALGAIVAILLIRELR